MTQEKIQQIRSKVSRDTMQSSTYDLVISVLDILERVQKDFERLQLDYEAFRETAGEIHQAYIYNHRDSWTFEEALRQIVELEDVRGIASKALETVWKRREERANCTTIME